MIFEKTDLLKEKEKLEEENKKLKKQINKAIDYIVHNYSVCAGIELLNILKGSDKE